MDNKIKCWMSHGDTAEKIPEGFKILAHTKNSFSAAIGNQERKLYGIQFHPEVIHTHKGTEILKNFSQNISRAKPNWNMERFYRNNHQKYSKGQLKSIEFLCSKWRN